MCARELLEKDLRGQTVIVTGATRGIGRKVAEQLFKQGATVVLAVRNTSLGAEVAAQFAVACAGGSGLCEVMSLDISSLASVREFAALFAGKHQSLHMLINNAGILLGVVNDSRANTMKRTTEDGFELTMATNHFGHFLLLNLLMPILQKSAPSRVVILTSNTHDMVPPSMKEAAKIDPHDLDFTHHPYSGWKAYSQSKLANLMCAVEAARRFRASNVSVVAVHPGTVETDIQVDVMAGCLQPIYRRLLSYQRMKNMIGMITLWEGAQTVLHCALSDAGALEPGGYYAQTNSPVNGYRDKALIGGWPMCSPQPIVHDPDATAKLWEVSERAVGL